jgi:hypothetical protein
MELTLDQWGLVLVAASKKVPKEKRASFQELLHALRTPVGGLGKGGQIESENRVREW